MNEYGHQTLEDISGSSVWGKAKDQILINAEFIKSSFEGASVGVKLSFENNIYISIVNLGDELFVFEQIPKEVVHDQGLYFIPVKPLSGERG